MSTVSVTHPFKRWRQVLFSAVWAGLTNSLLMTNYGRSTGATPRGQAIQGTAASPSSLLSHVGRGWSAARSQGRSSSPWRIPRSRELRPPANSHRRPILAAAPPASSSVQMSSQPLSTARLYHSLPEMLGQDHRDGVPHAPDWVSVRSGVACYAALGNRYTECHPASPHALLTQARPPSTICK